MIVRSTRGVTTARPRRAPAALVALASLALAGCGTAPIGQQQAAPAAQNQAAPPMPAGNAPAAQNQPASPMAAGNVPAPGAPAPGNVQAACTAAIKANPPDPFGGTVPTPNECAQLPNDALNAIIDTVFPQGLPIRVPGQPLPAAPDVAGCQAAAAQQPPQDPNIPPIPPAQCNGVPVVVYLDAMPAA